MKTALVISSLVASSQVGATASAFCLRRLGIETVVIPTTVLGRHPGWGPPGGSALPAEHLRDMWSAIKAQNIKFDAVMTGYFADDAHIEIAADIIKDVKSINSDAIILVDPVMGDNGALYIPASRAKAIKQHLFSIATLITPNIWEMSYITGHPAGSVEVILDHAADIPAACLVTSVPQKDKIGALFVDGTARYFVYHDIFPSVPHGGGDSLAGTFLAHILLGDLRRDALAKSVASVFSILSTAVSENCSELPLVKEQDALIIAKPLPINIL
ncbi:bifunctional hydroxymethylpyrimidine kinase/phosphomethylpyrimidine kinase [Hellea balneolensis]|uniref:bifunctional hydroxymethylpyrimidine kinase/phosphomethylpyrimidine kinase n=1 Tax=Hellea balneolensis TaxID=287478 RepID=UPI00047C8405|nr:bifunctional hydroxymethylpyrimidine kinase/phosphomethylpyrimidine kinase [Hellea balneolensis]